MKTYKPSELVYFELSNGDIWKLKPIGLGGYQVFDETHQKAVSEGCMIEYARKMVEQLGLTILEEC
jgi:hypothetical protein